MALDRNWYNSLVDDDGSGLTGSVWDKADVNALMNAIDAELATKVLGTTFTPYTPSLNSPNGVWTATQAYFRFWSSGSLNKIIHCQFSVEAGQVAVATSELQISVPVQINTGAWAGVQTTVGALYISGANEPVTIEARPNSPYYLHLTRMGGQQFPVGGPLYVRGQAWYLGT